MPSRIFLVGLPGAGKSTVGTYLAKELNYSFLDLDGLIEKEEGRTITNIFSEDGEAAFRMKESDSLRKLLGQKIVVATGGGAPCFHNNMQWLNENGFTVFLNPPIQVIIDRISKETHRPLMESNPDRKLKELIAERKKFYSQSGMESGLSEPYEILAELLQIFKD
jgi:shikimate kinase